MNWDAIAAFAESAGALAVVASLVFVGYQLRQTRFIERANAQRDLLVQAREWMSLLADDEEQFDAVRECLRDFEGADAFAKEQFNAWAFSLLFTMEQVFYMHRDGLLNEGSFHGFERAMLAVIRTRGGAEWWKLAVEIIGRDVGDYLASRLEEIGDSIPPWDELLPHLELSAKEA